MSNDITDGVLCFSFLFFSTCTWSGVVCVCVCMRACLCRAAIFNMATTLKLVCVKGLRGYTRFAVLFLKSYLKILIDCRWLTSRCKGLCLLHVELPQFSDACFEKLWCFIASHRAARCLLSYFHVPISFLNCFSHLSHRTHFIYRRCPSSTYQIFFYWIFLIYLFLFNKSHFNFFIFYLNHVEAHGIARTQNWLGHNRTKRTAEREFEVHQRQVGGINRGRLAEMRDVGKNEGKRKTQGVNKMDTAANSQSQKWSEKNWKPGKRWACNEFPSCAAFLAAGCIIG